MKIRSVRAAVAIALLASQAGAASSDAVSLENAQRLLATGDAVAAAAMYETLTRQGESLEAELGLVKAALQAGEFRRAMSWATLTAGEHTDSSEAVALLAWMQDRVGHTEQALAALRQLRKDRPSDPMATAALATVLIDRGSAVSSAETTAARRWPRPSFEPFPIGTHRVVAGGNGLIVDAGSHVLTYAALPERSSAIYVRNGLGKVRKAERVAGGAAGGLARLRIANPYPSSWAFPKEQVISPDGARFCFAFGFSDARQLDGNYPAISPGLVFRADAGIGDLMQITSPQGAGHSGSPVFDPRGRLLGFSTGIGEIVIGGENLRPKVGAGRFAVRAVPAESGTKRTSATPPRPAGPMPAMPAIEELYERLAPSVVQIIAVE